MKTRALRAVNRLLRRGGLELIGNRSRKPWDDEFARWIAEAKEAGVDPNDVGDREWQQRGGERDALNDCARHLFPHLTEQSTVLELGPGTGRWTRHVLPRCNEMILVDYSQVVCEWLSTYLRGKGKFRVYHIDRPVLPVTDSSVDLVFANGVFEHIDPDETDFFLQEFNRVLKPGGTLWFNFDNFMSPGGLAWFMDRRFVPPVGGRRLFRFYHPEFVKRMAEMRGFESVAMTTDETRFASLKARKRGAQSRAEK